MPIEFSLMKYRQLFHISYEQLLATPWKVVQQDLEMLELEQKMIQSTSK